jgi:two-component system NtrC family sensor kinase
MTVKYSKEDIALLCDDNQIVQALVALFVNAVEAMPEGGTISVDIQSSQNNDELLIIISDTGIGISQEDIPHIFEPFFTTKKDGKGVGLGLSVVYGIVERHGGKISVSSERNKGTTFTLTLPRLAHVQQHSDSGSGLTSSLEQLQLEDEETPHNTGGHLYSAGLL